MNMTTAGRALLLASLLFMVAAATPHDAGAQWSTDPTVNTAVSRLSSQEQHPLIVSDGADGAIIVWEYYANSLYGYDIAAQRLDSSGSIVWTGGVDVVAEFYDQKFHQIIGDGAGGVIVVWYDLRNESPSGGDIYAQRLNASGVAQWGTGGKVICTETNVQAWPMLVSDGAGGAIITWRDSRDFGTTGVDIYAQRISAAGTIMWTANGAPVCQSASNQFDPIIVSDGAGGAIIAWMDERNLGTTLRDVYTQRINASGVPQWTAGGVGYLANGNQTWTPGSNPIASDGASGAMIFWEDDYFGSADIDIRALRISATGTFPWVPASGVIAGASANQYLGRIASDGAGNAVVPWASYEYGPSDPDIGAQKLNAAGIAMWSSTAVCLDASPQKSPAAVMDAFGGAIITWHDERNADNDVYAQRFDAPGAYQWTYNGAEVSTATSHQDSPAIALAGTCGAIIVWRDLRWVGDPFDDTDWDVYGQRVYCNGTLMQRYLTLDTPNGGESWEASTQQLISWHGEGINNIDVRIAYSYDNGSTYDFVAFRTNTGTSGSYLWDVPNTPSTQCLVEMSVTGPPDAIDVSDATFTILAPSVAVEGLPVPDRLQLAQSYPNPGPGDITIPFGLPRSDHVKLSVYDVNGRLVRVVADRDAEPGWHSVRWNGASESGARVPHGIYYYELKSRMGTITRKAILLD